MEAVMRVLSSLFQWDNILFFLAGCVSTILFDKLKGRWMDKKFPKEAPHERRFNTRHIIMAVAAVFAIFVFVQSTTTQIDNRRTAQEVNACVLSFTEALSYRAKIATSDTELNNREVAARRMLDDAEGQLITTIFTNPAVLSGEVDDPSGLIEANRLYQEVRAKVDQERRDIDEVRNQNRIDREAYPYPEPTCGITTTA